MGHAIADHHAPLKFHFNYFKTTHLSIRRLQRRQKQHFHSAIFCETIILNLATLKLEKANENRWK